MDISTFATDAFAYGEMILKDPRTGDPMLSAATGEPVTFRIGGPDCKEAKEHTRKMQKLAIASAADGQKLTPEAIERRATAGLAAVTIQITGLTWGEKPIDASDKDVVVSLFNKVSFIRDQVEAFHVKRANFLPPLSAASSDGPSGNDDR